jgi:hypothetical protein
MRTVKQKNKSCFSIARGLNPGLLNFVGAPTSFKRDANKDICHAFFNSLGFKPQAIDSSLAILKNKSKNTWFFGFFLRILYLVKTLDFMGYSTKIQLIKRVKSEQWYVNFPAAVAQAIEFEQGEVVEWLIDDNQHLVLKRSDAAVANLKKKLKKKPKT